jgi:hypothetical protein
MRSTSTAVGVRTGPDPTSCSSTARWMRAELRELGQHSMRILAGHPGGQQLAIPVAAADQPCLVSPPMAVRCVSPQDSFIVLRTRGNPRRRLDSTRRGFTQFRECRRERRKSPHGSSRWLTSTSAWSDASASSGFRAHYVTGWLTQSFLASRRRAHRCLPIGSEMASSRQLRGAADGHRLGWYPGDDHRDPWVRGGRAGRCR